MTDATSPPDPGFGVYVHFPWCLKKCPYCDFLSIAADPSTLPHDSYADAVLAEIAHRSEPLEGRPLRSVFFGGGTPSLWEPKALGRVLRDLLDRYAVSDEAVEVTVECNPTSLDEARARALGDVGVNRLSIGVQSLESARLDFLGRWHDPSGAIAAVRGALAAGFERVSCDVIIGVAGQQPEEAQRDVATLADLGITHLSAYTLIVEPGTQFGARQRKGTLPLLPDDAVADSFIGVERELEARGFRHYEISNFARQNHLAEHNLGYWRGLDYVGLGCGAWGTVTLEAGRLRYRNTPVPDRYVTAAKAGAAPWSESDLVQQVEPLSSRTDLSERLMLGLRLDDGIDVEEAARTVGAEAWPKERLAAVERLVQRRRLLREGARLRIPTDAWLFADDTIARVM